MPSETVRQRARRWWPFVLLILCGASRWVFSAAHPDSASTAVSETIGCAWASLLLLASQGAGKQRTHAAWKMMLAGAMLAAGPAIAVLAVSVPVDSGALTIALALVPVVIGVAGSATGREPAESLSGRIWPGLAAVGGLMLVLVQPSLSNLSSDALFIVAPLLTGVGAVLFCVWGGAQRGNQGVALAGATLLFALGTAMAWGVTGARPIVVVSAVAWDGVLALLGVLALARLGATRWSAQFVLLPLFILLEGIVLMRPALNLRWASGLALLALGSGYLLLPSDEDAALEEAQS
jgi:hypothetical protein